MIILAYRNAVTICADERDIKAGVKHFYVLKYGKIYDPDDDFRTMSGTYKTQLSKDSIKEFNLALPEAEKMWETERMRLLASEKSSQSNVLNDKLTEMLANILAEQSADAIFAATMPKVREKIIEEFGILPQIHEIRTPKDNHKIQGITHEQFDTVLSLVYDDIPVFLSGAAGTGKNVICKQVAESLGLDFYFTNAVTQEYKLTGFIDANGTYHETQFYKAFKDGGLFFLDEMDGSIPEVLIMLNAAIANRYFDFPTGKIEANENFRVIAAGNTYGTGADLEYTGRYQLDAASLDRFALVEVDYSPKIENAISEGDNELCEFIRAFRKAVKNAGMKHIASYRSIERIHKLAGALDLKDVLRISLLKNMKKDDINIILKEMSLGNNRYYCAMKEA